MSSWSRTRGGVFGRAVSSFSLALALASAVWGQFSELDARLERSKSEAEARETLLLFRQDSATGSLIERLEQERASLDEIRGTVRLYAEAERLGRYVPGPNVQERAREIKRAPLYQDPGPARESNWVARGFQRLGEWIEALLSRATPSVTPAPSTKRPSGQWIITTAWVLLGLGVAAFAVFAVRKFSMKPLWRRRMRPLLEEDEPERTADEWLAHAATLEAEGRHREAVRCLYVACLVRLDEAGIARFVRGETNWEHLRRIEANPLTPSDLDFRTATGQFDRIWYGHRVRGAEDVDAFRQHYARVTGLLGEKGAAP